MPTWILIAMIVLWIIWSIYVIGYFIHVMNHNSNVINVAFNGEPKYTKRGARQAYLWFVVVVFFLGYSVSLFFK